MKKYLFFLCGILLSLNIVMLSIDEAYSQILERQVISSSGGEYSNTNLNLNFTLGEAVTETFQNSGLILTQGFQQSLPERILIIKI